MFKKLLSGVFSLFVSVNAYADQPVPWQLGFQKSVTPIMDRFVDFHNELLIIIFAVSIFVVLLIAYVCIKFNAKSNPVPSKTSHNTLIEIIWTVVPVLILVYICVPSMKTLYYNETVPEDAEMTLKVIGKQWYWTYQYPDQNLAFDSRIVADEDLKEGQPRLLTVDNQVVIPVDTTIRLQSTGGDVIHNWAIPAFGTKLEAVPGRLNEGWLKVKETGTYYGQCSELCGTGHGFMPIAVKVVTKEEFEAWVEQVKPEFGVES
ncbi:MAG: cytochrome c oxidase subunit II [Alphaproteobacteria bacterium CG11_big_fil_rev_8_21_14_0_20_39_49]|nr:MAG: cytochrome c oxidase subunit II [Alphaproteobacteria bacterium CG11_big_fil_rev_8_21_14_0_20_39_49]